MAFLYLYFIFMLLLQYGLCQNCPNLTVVTTRAYSQINASIARDNKYGVEDGTVIRTSDGNFHLVTAEMYADPGR
jgi:hypothetical protein